MDLRDAEARLWGSLGVEAREHRLALERLRTTVRVTEIGEGPPVLFIHGATVAGPSWADLVVRMPGFRCLLLDRPGCGLSDPLPGPVDVDAFETMARELVADVLDALELSSAHVVGTSLGGYPAVRSAAAHPERVDRLGLVGWVLGTPLAVAPISLRLGSTPIMRALTPRMPVSAGSVRSLLRRVGLRRAIDEGKFSDEALAWVVALYRGTDTMRHETADGPRLTSVRSGWIQRVLHTDEQLGRVQAPTCIVYGDEDPFGSEEAARDLADRIGDAEVHVLEAAGHAPWLDQGDEVARILTGFLQRT